MNRRDLIKTAITVPILGLLRPGKIPPKTSSRAVQYGKAQYDYLPGWNILVTGRKGLWGGVYQFCTNDMVQVYCPKLIKKGQALTWYPDGSVVGS